MKKKVALTLLGFVMICAAYAQTTTAREIMDEQADRHGSDSEFSVEKMTLIDRNNNQEVRAMRRYSKKLDEEQSRFLMVFDSPDSIRGTALLTWTNKDAGDDQWMYLPAQDRLQRIASGSKKGYFMGTDFTFEDIQPDDADNFDYDIIEETTISGLPCWVIQAVPNNEKTEQASGYSKRVMYVLQGYYFTIKVEFFDRHGSLVKTQQNGLLKKINDQRFRANKVIMVNHGTGHKTVLKIVDREIDQGLDSDIFTERHITSGRHLQ
jgi:hypothetical protein